MHHLLSKLVSAASKLKLEDISSLERNYFSEQILVSVYQMSSSGVQLTDEERTIFGALIKEFIDDLDLCLFDLVLKFDPDRGSYNHILRSGIQFLLDNFKEFPVNETEVLGDSLKQIEESGNIEDLDEELILLKDNPLRYVDWEYDDWESICHPESDFLRPAGIPESHIWWS